MLGKSILEIFEDFKEILSLKKLLRLKMKETQSEKCFTYIILETLNIFGGTFIKRIMPNLQILIYSCIYSLISKDKDDINYKSDLNLDFNIEELKKNFLILKNFYEYEISGVTAFKFCFEEIFSDINKKYGISTQTKSNKIFEFAYEKNRLPIIFYFFNYIKNFCFISIF